MTEEVAKYHFGELIQRFDGVLFAVYGSELKEVELPTTVMKWHITVRKRNANGTWSHKFELIETQEGDLKIVGKWSQ